MMGWRAYSSVPALIVACWTENASAVVAREAMRRAAENFMVRRGEGGYEKWGTSLRSPNDATTRQELKRKICVQSADTK
jgi:hypothetical protein